MKAESFNLTALSDRLFAEKRLLSLAGKIRRAQHLGSMHADLVMAAESLDALEELYSQSPSDDFSRQITEFALLSNALLLYARATKTTSKERGSFDLLSRFSADEKVVHQELVDLRDHAIAHFGSGGSYQGLWQAETVILQTTDEGGRVGVPTRRATRDRQLAARARKQVETARALIFEITQQKNDDVTDELNSMTPEVLKEEVFQHPINLDIFLGSSEAANAARTSANQGGYTKGIVRTPQNSSKFSTPPSPQSTD
ncbi:hypothetical protein [Hyphomonas sp.]|uniref:hypothetical protein n=1 Tax=Hyphomonas sp. TaxID=87 RepID=UPI0025BF190F|nr:hypothetical protein [Hyphomonas sp.]